MLNEFNKTVCAWALARFLHHCPEKLDTVMTGASAGKPFSSPLLLRYISRQLHIERVVGAGNLGGQPVFGVQGQLYVFEFFT